MSSKFDAKALHAKAKQNRTYLKIWLAIAFAIAIGGEWETVGLITLAWPHVIPAFNRFRGKGVVNKAGGFWVGRAIMVAVFSALFVYFAIDESFTFALLVTVIGAISARMYLKKDKVMAVGIFASLFFLEFGTHVTIAVALLVTLFSMFPREIAKKENKSDDGTETNQDEQQFGTGLLASITEVVGTQWTQFQSRYPQFTDFASFKAHIDGLLAEKNRLLREKDAQIAALLQQLSQRGPVQPIDETSQDRKFGPVEEFGPVPAPPHTVDDDRPYRGPATTQYGGDTTYGRLNRPEGPVQS